MTWRSIISSLVGLSLAASAFAGPARPGIHLYRQPDGTTISIVLHGDEFRHWATDPAGNLLELDAKGFYRIATGSGRRLSKAQTPARRHRGPSKAYMTTGERHIPVILIEFADVEFSLDNISERFDRMLNEPGYSDNGATGSVRDFYVENSRGLFTPVFDVLEPVRLDKNMAAYGANVTQDEDKAPEIALYEACLLLDQNTDTDFSAYDADEDGQVDMILYYYAGYDEAQAGQADAIWSHQWDVQESENAAAKNARFDGKALGRYFCTSELYGSSGTRMTGIGTTCHEFAHSLGLPDFYDTDYTTGGLSGGFYAYSTMCEGSYNNSCRTPPYFNILERTMLGWVEESAIQELPQGNVLWAPVQENAAYMVPTDVAGEYFIWEYRNSSGWDSFLPKGLILYHIDRSENIAFDGKPAIYYWDNWETLNNLNNVAAHPLAYIIPSSQPKIKNYQGKPEGIPFPGLAGVTCFDSVGWSGEGTDYQLTDIRLSQENALAYVLKGYGTNVSGVVSSIDGEAVPGAVIGIDISESITVSAQDGRFVLDLPEQASLAPFVLSVSADGYRKTQVGGVLDWRSAYIPVSLMREGESTLETLRKYDASLDRIFFPLPSRDFGDCMGAVRFNAGELFRYTGRRIEKISFSTYGSATAEAVYVIVDIGSRRVLTREVENPMYGLNALNEVDISDADIRIPEGEDIYIGYGIKGSSQVFPLGVTREGHKDNSYYGRLNLEHSSWEPMTSSKVSSGYMDLLLGAGVREVTNPSSLAEMGYAFIDLGDNSWKAGDVLELKLAGAASEPVSVTWLFDGEITFDTSVSLTKGGHIIQALVDYGKGKSESLKTVITCE